jgi:transposase
MVPDKDAKRSLLRKQGVLHPHPETVTAPLFHDSGFFDPQDLIQVKYEMLRRVQIEHTTVSQASQEAGMSRPAFYQAQSSLEGSGLAGLIPQKPGPRGAHKLTAPVLAFLRQRRAAQPELTFSELAKEVGQEFDIQIHPRTIERVLLHRQKKP